MQVFTVILFALAASLMSTSATAASSSWLPVPLSFTSKNESEPASPIGIRIEQIEVCIHGYTDSNLIGNDIGAEPGATPFSCLRVCVERDGCKAFTWTDYQGGTCWLKSGSSMTEVQVGAVSGYVVRKQGVCGKVGFHWLDTDYVGGDLANAPSTDIRACFRQCLDVPRCSAYTWSAYNGGTCWFKTDVRDVRAAPGTNSGLVSTTTPTVV